MTGHDSSHLVVLRGPSGSGKTSLAQAMRTARGRGLALVQQDLLRRTVLRERDVPGGANIGLLDLTARYALDHGFDVVLEGILDASRYSLMLTDLVRAHRGTTTVVYLDVPLDETLRRHAGRPQANEFTVADMRSWYQPGDLLGLPGELTIDHTTSLPEATEQILTTTWGGCPAERPLTAAPTGRT
ncbi:AAA family ATPase [Amycolatopsis magusensis]|uniref:AAA family ATPase n=1 Tax=Amycolatopsis magusensis TaxID=882444 RepID=UPI0037926FFC